MKEQIYRHEITDSGTVVITGCSSDEEEFVIPDRINGYPVSHIGNGAFYKKKRLMRIVIPESVCKIGSKAFMNCDQLKKIVIPASVQQIADDTFEGCPAVLIRTEENSTAHEFALQHEMKFALPQTSISAELPSGNAPTTRVCLRISRFRRLMTLFVRIRVLCSEGNRSRSSFPLRFRVLVHEFAL